MIKNKAILFIFFYLPFNKLWLECVIPHRPASTVSTFANKHGLALHHLGFISSDLIQEKTKRQNIRSMFPIGSYSLFIKSFGGNIKTLFLPTRSYH